MTDERSGGQFARAEFEAAILPLLEAVARLARFLLRGHRADAEDLVQDAALRAFQAVPRFGRGTNLRAWLFRILRNTYVDRLRRSGREKQFIDREAELPESGAALEELLAQARRDCSAADLEVARERLPADLRVVLLLVDGEKMRYDEVAHVKECPVGTVRSRLHRERHLLRRQRLEVSGEPGLELSGVHFNLHRFREGGFWRENDSTQGPDDQSGPARRRRDPDGCRGRGVPGWLKGRR